MVATRPPVGGIWVIKPTLTQWVVSLVARALPCHGSRRGFESRTTRFGDVAQMVEHRRCIPGERVRYPSSPLA